MKNAPDHKPDPKLIRMFVQHGDLPAFEVPELLELIAADVHARRPAPEAEDPVSDETELASLRDQVRKLREDLDELPAKLAKSLKDLIEKLADLEEIDRAADKRLDAIEKALKALKPKAPAKPAEEPATAA